MDQPPLKKSRPLMDPAKHNEDPQRRPDQDYDRCRVRTAEANKITAEAALSFAAAESRMSFVYGLISGPIVFSFGGVMFLLLRRKRPVAVAQPSRRAGQRPPDDQGDVHRMVAAVLAEQARRDGTQRPSIASERQHAADEAPVH